VPLTVVLGCGFAGQRVARALAAQGLPVLGTTHDPAQIAAIRGAGAAPLLVDCDGGRGLDELRRATEGEPARAVLAVPPGPAGSGSRAAPLLGALGAAPSRVVYLSSTAVYGAATRVDETTPATPVDAAGARRLAEEQAVAAGPWSWIALRAAAVYGPGRGLLADPPRFARGLDAVRSRIHVDDLAALACAALEARLEGAFPVADEEPASPREMLAFLDRGCAAPPGPEAVPPARIVDGRAVRQALGVSLRFPSYRAALPVGARV
jgi:nucleoside-diphosphate-sugar epimerase